LPPTVRQLQFYRAWNIQNALPNCSVLPTFWTKQTIRPQAHLRRRRPYCPHPPAAILRWVSSNRRSGAPCAAEEAKRTWSGCATMTSAPAAVPRGAGTESGDGFDLGRRLCCDPTSHRRLMSVRNQRKGWRAEYFSLFLVEQSITCNGIIN
jgi:hypothetical protein